MKIQAIATVLETLAPTYLQESYDNVGLLVGNADADCNGVLITLDVTEEIVQEAVAKKCNLIVAHHPLIFSGLKKIVGKNYVDKTVIAALKNDIAIYAIHTNLDNVLYGVNGKMADKLGLINRKVLQPKNDLLKKIITYAPVDVAEKVRTAIFDAGAGHINNYSECSFTSTGIGTFKPQQGADPFVGKIGQRHEENEVKIEAIFPAWLQQEIITALRAAHPYEEPAYDILTLDNYNDQTGSGLVGDLPKSLPEKAFLKLLQEQFQLSVIRHTPLTGKMVEKVALCGGAGSFLIGTAVATGADFYITSDVKYHEFFDANNQLVIADIGHYESEQYTIDLLFDILTEKFPTFAVLKTAIKTNPVQYFLG